MINAAHSTLRCFLILLPCLTLPACATSERALKSKGFSALTGAELEALFAKDRTVTWMNARTMGEATYAADGRASMSWKSGSDTGTWRIKDNTFCITWTTVRSKEACYSVYKVGDMAFKQFWPDGSWNADFSVTQ